MGDTSSAWQGVEYRATSDITTSSTPIKMTGVSASNTDYATQTTSAYGDVSFFYGYLTYDTTVSPNPYVTIIKQVTRDEQTLLDGTYTRLEAGR